ncbi:MAG: zf-HC2 domain-containing protein [Gemmatimonadetes bacterium]|nr:zf-HC2 domain-containing protein [Gemmatimonadota bacterium]
MMSHISKGDIHAYLDGALGAYPEEAARHVREHLDACRVCAQVLEEERRLREEASAILAASALGPVELDSLEELRARATALDGQERAEGAKGPERADRMVRARPSLAGRMYSIRWAATVVISLGAGWMAREVTGPTGDATGENVREPVVREVGVRSPDAQEREASLELMERDNAGRFAEAETLPASPSSEVVEGVPPVSDRAAGGFDDDAVLDQVEALPVRQREESAVARGAGPADASVAAQVEETPVEEAPVQARIFRDELRSSTSAVDRRDRAVLLGNEARRALAGETVSNTPFLVPGLPVRDVRLAPRDGGQGGGAGGAVVVTQELPDGRVVELRFVPLAGSDSVLGGALRERNEFLGRSRQAGWGMAVRDVSGGVAILSGPLTERELEDLLDRALGLR